METDGTQNGTVRTNCITLRAVPFGEADLMLTLFSEQDGRVDARAYGARSMKSAYRAACQPFCASEMEFYLKGGRRSVKAAHVRSEFFGIQEKYSRYAAGCSVLELTDRILRHAPPEETRVLFRLLVACLRALDTTDAPAYVLLFYLIRVLHHLGVFPSLRHCACCGEPLKEDVRWSKQEGGLICGRCAEEPQSAAMHVDPGVRSCLSTFGRGQICSDTDMSCAPQMVAMTTKLLQEFLEYQLGVRLRTLQMTHASRGTPLT